MLPLRAEERIEHGGDSDAPRSEELLVIVDFEQAVFKGNRLSLEGFDPVEIDQGRQNTSRVACR